MDSTPMDSTKESLPALTDTKTNDPPQSDGIIRYSPRRFEQCDISKSTLRNFKQAVMVRVSGKGATFSKFDFRFAEMTDCYFHGARFEGCDFTGAKFKRCNFRTATFSDCKFDYLTIDETPIDYQQVVRLLPDRPNVAQEILQALRRNAVTLGDVGEARDLTLKEISQEAEHLRRALRGNGEYYKKKYGTFSDKVGLRYRLWKLKLSSLIWGHGERLSNIVLSSLILILILSLTSTGLDVFKVPSMTVVEFLGALKSYCIENGQRFLGIENAPKGQQHWGILWLGALARIIFTGMFVAVIFRNLSRR